MSNTLRDGTMTEDIRLDRIEEFDERSKEYPLMLAPSKKARSYTWRCNAHLDQGTEGSCVGHGIAHELAARPAEVVGMTHTYAKETIYWAAQRIDRWPGGAYPGAKNDGRFYEGTAVLAGVKIAHKLGWFDSYRWAFGIDDLIMGVGHNGPAVMGLKWYEGMINPDTNNFIQPTGKTIGGHCLLCNAINVKESYFTLHNSWGAQWGFKGECKITFDDMDKLLKQRGEAVFFQKRHRNAQP